MARMRCKLSEKEYKQKDHSRDLYICTKCGRTAKSEQKLCKAKKISKQS